MNQIKDLTDKIKSNKSKLKLEVVVNLADILSHSDLVITRYKELVVHLTERYVLLLFLL